MKTAIDTNILVRLITGDVKELVKKAQQLVDSHSDKDIFVSYGVILELYFVLKHHYKFPEKTALDAVEDVLKIKQFNIEHKIAVQLAINKARNKFGFYDALIGEIGILRNVKTYTFDKALAKNTNFIVLK